MIGGALQGQLVGGLHQPCGLPVVANPGAVCMFLDQPRGLISQE